MPDNDKTPTIEPCPMPGCGGEMSFGEAPLGCALICCVCSFRIKGYDKPNVRGRYDQLCERNRLGKAAQAVIEKPPEYCGIHNESSLWNSAVKAVLDRLRSPEPCEGHPDEPERRE